MTVPRSKSCIPLIGLQEAHIIAYSLDVWSMSPDYCAAMSDIEHQAAINVILAENGAIGWVATSDLHNKDMCRVDSLPCTYLYYEALMIESLYKESTLIG
jgi:hypothetical protein